MPTAIYAIVCRDEVMFASTEYDEVVKRRNAIDPANGGCDEPHPIRTGRVVLF